MGGPERAALELDGLVPEKVACWTDRRIARALRNAQVIRSPQKIAAMIDNARL